MTIRKKLTALALLIALLLTMALPVNAAEESTDQLVRKLINYFHYYQRDSQLDQQLLLAEINKQDPALADTWRNILTFWTALNDDMEFHSNVLPDGLPEDDSLCIVVMGYQLKPEGGIRDELAARLKVVLASAEKYPNAYILCTGGGTASKNSKVTEAGQMAKWLVNNGIDSDRIIVEDDALSTIQNAIYGCKLLYRKYPQVKSLAVITSDYHIYRSCLYFHVQAALDAYEEGVEPMMVVANATCRVNPGASKDLDRQVEGVGMLTDLDVVDMSRPKLSQLDYIRVSGQTEYAFGSELNLTVTAYYTSGYSREVTANTLYSGYDFGASGFQTITISYQEGSRRVRVEFEVYVIPPETEPSVTEEIPEDASDFPEPTAQPITATEEPETAPRTAVYAVVGLIALWVMLMLIKAKQQKKRRRPKPVIHLD